MSNPRNGLLIPIGTRNVASTPLDAEQREAMSEELIDRTKFLERLYALAGTTQQKALAQIADVTSASMCRIQQGQSFPSVQTLSRLAMILNVSMDYLVGITDDPTPAARSSKAMKKALETPIDRANVTPPRPPRRATKK